MLAEIGKKWVAALRSGKYMQGQMRLKRSSTADKVAHFCCLGVLCDLYSKEVGVEWTRSKPSFACSEYDNYAICDKNTTLPDEVKKWMGALDKQYNPEGVPLESSYEQQLIRLNDIKYATFFQIADYIEANMDAI